MPDVQNTLTVKLKLDNSELIQQLEALIAGAKPAEAKPAEAATPVDTLVLRRRLAHAERLLSRAHSVLSNTYPISPYEPLSREIARYVDTIGIQKPKASE